MVSYLLTCCFNLFISAGQGNVHRGGLTLQEVGVVMGWRRFIAVFVVIILGISLQTLGMFVLGSILKSKSLLAGGLGRSLG